MFNANPQSFRLEEGLLTLDLKVPIDSGITEFY
jgi:hypothetical protein